MTIRFDTQGHSYRIVTLREHEQLAWLQLLDEEDNQYDGDLFIINKTNLHDKPPRPKVDKAITEANAELADLRKQIQDKKKLLREAEDATKKRLKLVKQDRALERIEDFLEGKITFFVEQPYSYCWSRAPYIIKASDAKTKDGGYYNDALKLLTLFGKSDGNLEWGLNKYSDGSGSNVLVYPCVSYAEAIKVIIRLFTTHENAVNDPESKEKPSREWIKAMEKCYCAVSEEYIIGVENEEKKEKDKTTANIQSQIKELKNKLEKSKEPHNGN